MSHLTTHMPHCTFGASLMPRQFLLARGCVWAILGPRRLGKQLPCDHPAGLLTRWCGGLQAVSTEALAIASTPEETELPWPLKVSPRRRGSLAFPARISAACLFLPGNGISVHRSCAGMPVSLLIDCKCVQVA